MSDTNVQLNPTIIKAFIGSTMNVLSTMAGIQARVGKPALKAEPHPSYDVSGIIGFSGDVTGSVVVSFSSAAAVRIVEAFGGDHLEVNSEDFADAIGELCNMIAGNAKKDFGLNASISIPSVVIGPGHTVARLKDVPCVTIPCSSDFGDFAVEVNIKQLACAAVGGR